MARCCRSCATASSAASALFMSFPLSTERSISNNCAAAADVVAAQRRRQLEVATPQETYLRGGRFDKNAMLALIQETLKTGTTLGFALTRLVAHAETVLEDWANVNDWIEYETRVNEVLPRYSDPVICTYDTNLLNGAIAVDILRTHPVAIIGGLLHENPFFVPPQELLRQVLHRGGERPKAYRG